MSDAVDYQFDEGTVIAPGPEIAAFAKAGERRIVPVLKGAPAGLARGYDGIEQLALETHLGKPFSIVAGALSRIAEEDDPDALSAERCKAIDSIRVRLTTVMKHTPLINDETPVAGRNVAKAIGEEGSAHLF